MWYDFQASNKAKIKNLKCIIKWWWIWDESGPTSLMGLRTNPSSLRANSDQSEYRIQVLTMKWFWTNCLTIHLTIQWKGQSHIQKWKHTHTKHAKLLHYSVVINRLRQNQGNWRVVVFLDVDMQICQQKSQPGSGCLDRQRAFIANWAVPHPCYCAATSRS